MRSFNKRQISRLRAGFTLMELLIVVAIISILASLLIPRLIPQTERVIIAEGVQMLGALRRAQLGYADRTGAFLPFGNYDPQAQNGPDQTALSVWSRLGLQPLPTNSRFSYQCDNTNCTATRLLANIVDGRIQMNIVTGAIGYGISYEPHRETFGAFAPTAGLMPVLPFPETPAGAKTMLIERGVKVGDADELMSQALALFKGNTHATTVLKATDLYTNAVYIAAKAGLMGDALKNEVARLIKSNWLEDATNTTEYSPTAPITADKGDTQPSPQSTTTDTTDSKSAEEYSTPGSLSATGRTRGNTAAA